MERNKYELQREVLARKYETILKDFEDTNDDRRIAWNCYQQIIGACEAMRDSGMENNFVCCAVNKSIREQETEIDNSAGHAWTEEFETQAKCLDWLREVTT